MGAARRGATPPSSPSRARALIWGAAAHAPSSHWPVSRRESQSRAQPGADADAARPRHAQAEPPGDATPPAPGLARTRDAPEPDVHRRDDITPGPGRCNACLQAEMLGRPSSIPLSVPQRRDPRGRAGVSTAADPQLHLPSCCSTWAVRASEHARARRHAHGDPRCSHMPFDKSLSSAGSTSHLRSRECQPLSEAWQRSRRALGRRHRQLPPCPPRRSCEAQGDARARRRRRRWRSAAGLTGRRRADVRRRGVRRVRRAMMPAPHASICSAHRRMRPAWAPPPPPPSMLLSACEAA
jgi:hypothetical protein